jgi:S-DNA-T family DNA segregation ATPase FtsK/SpoIIIE
VTGPIRANTDLRIALRVSSADDSRDVIDSPEAARISRRTPGRAWIRRTGHGTAELVQSAWTGARQPVDASENKVRVQAFSAAGSLENGLGEEVRLDPRTDLVRCVTTIRTAFARTEAAPPKRPWLPPLPAELLLEPDRLMADAGQRRTGRVVLGRVDEPGDQQQPELLVDLSSVGHVLVYGASGSGKTELLRTTVLSASLGDAFGAQGVAPYVYGIDHAGGGLAAIAGLPTVEAVVPESHQGRILRLLRLLRRTVTDRTSALAAHGCSDLDDLARMGTVLPRVYVVIDNLPALVESLESAGGVAREHLEHIQNVLQNGRRVGIHVIATAPGRTGVPTALAATFGRRIVLRMTTTDDYLMLGVRADVLDADSAPGAGLLNRSGVQIATTGGAGTPVQAERVKAIGALLAPKVAGRGAAPVPAMPARLDQDALPAPTGTRVPLAVDADAVAVVEVDLLGPPVVIAGRSRSGRTSALDAVAALVERAERPPRVIRTADPVACAAEVDAWRTAERDPQDWALLLVDDAHRWDSIATTDDVTRAALGSLQRVMADPGSRLGAVVTADMTQAKQRGGPDGLVSAARQGRRGFILQPEWNDGDVLGVTVPSKTTEPLTGPGRGLWCEAGSAWVAQLVTHAGVEAGMAPHTREAE